MSPLKFYTKQSGVAWSFCMNDFQKTACLPQFGLLLPNWKLSYSEKCQLRCSKYSLFESHSYDKIFAEQANDLHFLWI